MELNKLSENKWFSDWIVSLGDLTEIIFTSINEEISENTDIFVIDHTILNVRFISWTQSLTKSSGFPLYCAEVDLHNPSTTLESSLKLN